MHRPLSHLHKPTGHVRFAARQSAGSSIPSEQSRRPSHTHEYGIQRPFPHRNSARIERKKNHIETDQNLFPTCIAFNTSTKDWAFITIITTIIITIYS